MVKVKNDLTGQVFGRLTVLYQTEDYVTPSGKHQARWRCVCSCSEHNEIDVVGGSLTSGLTKSCGCLRIEATIVNGNNNKKYNSYSLDLIDEHGKYGIGYCSNTGREFYFDMEDYDKIKNYCWCENKMSTGYCRLETRDKEIGQSILMHWIIADKRYDHIDRNPLNNRKYNLRTATIQENAMNHSKQKNNTSGVIGVYWHSGHQKWGARIGYNNEQIHLGYFDSKDEATIVRLEAAKKYHNEFSSQKDLFDIYEIS